MKVLQDSSGQTNAIYTMLTSENYRETGTSVGQKYKT